ncbi:hypothetical protein J4464_05955 [Candidatus Woesearchaeota archaeon]|nr:hypothetical protein [Candidatus Woesearchaeota archaeon]
MESIPRRYETMEKKIGNWSFIIGVVIAIILGLASRSLPMELVGLLTSLLVILGLIVGFINVTGKDTKEFLIISAILVFTAYAGGAAGQLSTVLYVGEPLAGVFKALLAFLVPATVVVALKEIYYLAQA